MFSILNTIGTYAQVGINTTDPEGALDIVSTDQGVVMPRVSAVENVVTPDGNPAVDGTIVYDLSRQQMCMRIQGTWVCTDLSGNNTTILDNELTNISAYIKASNTGASDRFGVSVSMSADGNYLAIGSFSEDSNATGINGDDTDNTATNAGAVYVFTRSGSTWVQQAYVKASNTEVGDSFGFSLDLSADGSYLVVGATGEDSNATGINGNETDNSAIGTGAVYVFMRSGSTWSQQAYIKASNAETNDFFGRAVKISSDSNYMAVGAYRESSGATGINGDETDNTIANSGAVYVFSRSGTSWSQQAYIKASNTGLGDEFGEHLSISSDGSYLVVSAEAEDSIATGINGNETDNSASLSGAVYVFTRSGSTWSQQAYIKASNAQAGDLFGNSISISADGSYLAVGAFFEDSNATGINGDETNNLLTRTGAVYVFLRSGTTWNQIAYIKSPNSDFDDRFGFRVAISGDGKRLAVSAFFEDSNATGLNGDQSNNGANTAGAVYTYNIIGSSITFDNYIKASNTEAGDTFGYDLAISANGATLLVSAYDEDSNATGVGGDQTDNSTIRAGAAYVIE